MCDRASAQIQRNGDRAARTLCCDALDLPLPDASVDVVVSTFGLKTFTDDEWLRLGREVARILKPGGRFAFLEFSVPPSPLLRLPFRLYVEHYVPLIGRLVLGNPDHYRLLWQFTSRFENCERVVPAFRQAGLEVSVRSRFFGCATELIGKRPELCH
jgi:demethylmenaquinone methyltransferase/2-methoxy-6-polyprenyl-1,4-benzoquinol methylase